MPVYVFYSDAVGTCCTEGVLNCFEKLPQVIPSSFQFDCSCKPTKITFTANLALSSEQIFELLAEKNNLFRLYGVKQIDLQTSLNLRAPFVPLNNALVRKHLFKAIPAIVLGVAMMTIMLAGVMFPLWSMILIAAASTLLVCYAGHDIARRAWQNKSLSMDLFFTISVSIALVVSMVGLFFPFLALPCLFDAALMIVGFRHLGRAIELSVESKLSKDLTFVDLAPKTVSKKQQDNTHVTTPVADLVVNDVITLDAEMVVPVDGIAQGTMQIDRSLQTGKVLPVNIHLGGEVFAGDKILGSATVDIQVQKTIRKSTLQQLDDKLSTVLAEKSPLETAADQMLRRLIPLLFLIALIAGIAVGCCMNIFMGIQVAIYILVAVCPCTLGFIVPFIVKLGLRCSVDSGAVFNNGAALEAAADIDTVVLDFNGTLTTGQVVVKAIELELQSGCSEADIPSLLFTLESQSQHPIARAICDHVRDATVMESFSEFELSGNGVKGVWENVTYSVGNMDYFDEGTRTLIQTSYARQLQTSQHTVFLVRQRGDEIIILACVSLEDPLRDNAHEVVDALRQQGKKIKICTGSPLQSVERMALQLGMEKKDIEASCVGADKKAEHVKKLQAGGARVTMVGDGLNDAIALSASACGVAMASDLSHALTQSHAKLRMTDLSSLPRAFDIADNTVSAIRQNVGFSFAYNVVAVLLAPIVCLAFSVMLNPGIAAGLMVLQSVLVLLNVYRISKQATSKNVSASAVPEDKNHLMGSERLVSASPIMGEADAQRRVRVLPYNHATPPPSEPESLERGCLHQ